MIGAILLIEIMYTITQNHIHNYKTNPCFIHNLKDGKGMIYWRDFFASVYFRSRIILMSNLMNDWCNV